MGSSTNSIALTQMCRRWWITSHHSNAHAPSAGNLGTRHRIVPKHWRRGRSPLSESEEVRKQADLAWEIFSHDGRVRWFAKDGSRRYGGWLDSADRLAGAIEIAAALKRDFYLQANVCDPKFNGVKCATKHITHWRMLIEDYDPAGDVGGQPLPPPAALNSRRKVVCFSGRGWQLWTRLELRAVVDAAQCERGMAAWLRHPNRALYPQDGWKLDPTCSDLARVVRCPGSVNTKTGARARVRDAGEVLRAHDTILRLAGPPPEPVNIPLDVDLTKLLSICGHLMGSSRNFILNGIPTPGRHARAYSTAKNLSEIGVLGEDAERWLMHGAAKSSPPLPHGEVKRIIRQVYGG